MSIEYIRFSIAYSEQELFIPAIMRANVFLENYKDCLEFEVTQCEEDNQLFIWRIVWTSTQAHLEGFRNDKVFKSFKKIMEPYIPFILEMNHYKKIR
jgi:heme-degrading monooxygenase HmoA